ncbi:hypothetical protein CEXT_583871 [Caerostris extrusa]|uniref:Uncharacterized protein n=1 Tax=Caerostris extrusa TaxID=172846 RepID=A0AAV4RVN0_CAEEX|nr:hypothetical protein CEXT_583871 [Caerostris extrusa]
MLLTICSLKENQEKKRTKLRSTSKMFMQVKFIFQTQAFARRKLMAEQACFKLKIQTHFTVGLNTVEKKAVLLKTESKPKEEVSSRQTEI